METENDGKSMPMQNETREKRKQIINCDAAFIAGKTLLIIASFSCAPRSHSATSIFFSCFLIHSIPFLPCIRSRCVCISVLLTKFDICMQLKLDGSSCGNPFGECWKKCTELMLFNEQTTIHRTEPSIVNLFHSIRRIRAMQITCSYWIRVKLIDFYIFI